MCLKKNPYEILKCFVLIKNIFTFLDAQNHSQLMKGWVLEILHLVLYVKDLKKIQIIHAYCKKNQVTGEGKQEKTKTKPSYLKIIIDDILVCILPEFITKMKPQCIVISDPFYYFIYLLFHLNCVIYAEFEIKKSSGLRLAGSGPVQNSFLRQTFASVPLLFFSV